MMGARIPQDWAEQIEAIAAENECTTADVCRMAYAQFLGTRQKKRGNIQQRVRTLEKQFAALTAQLIAEDTQ